VRRSAPSPAPVRTHAQEARELAIARAVWTDFDSRADVAARLVRVQEVLEGRPVPTLSRADREAIEAATARISEGARP
jgi:hypothetical protein